MGKLIDKTFLKFLLVGVINTLVGTGTMFALYNLAGLSYWICSAANYLVGGIVSYFLNKNFTFRKKTGSVKQILFFAANTALCWLLAYGISKPLMLQLLADSSVRLQENIAMVCGMCLYTGLNYLGQRFIVFRSKD